MSASGHYRDLRRVTEIDQLIGQRVRVRRTLLDMSQEALAEMLGVSFQQLQKYEKGINRISASRLFELSQALRVPVGYFFEDVRVEGEATQVQSVMDKTGEPAELQSLICEKTTELLRSFLRIKNPGVRRAIVNQVRAIADIASQRKGGKGVNSE